MSAPHSNDAGTRRAELAEALIAVAAADHRAFRRVYDMTSAKLFGICLRICGTHQDATDVLHDVYLTVWKQAGAYEPGRASPITWLATIARNRAIDWRRADQGRLRAPLDSVPDRADATLSAIDRLLLDERELAVRDCLDALEDAQRSAIRAAFFDGFTYAEQADRSATPLGTMKSRIRRGLIRLRECLDGRI